MTATSSSAALDRFDADLAATEKALADGGREPHRTVPAIPQGLFPPEPIPPELAPRAEDLLRRTRDLEALATAELDGIREGLRALAGHRPPAPKHTGRIVDVGA
jgi:hypothetical protein